MPDFGVMFRCQKPPETLPDYVQRVEAAGFDEVWVVEDCFFAGGIASAATALAHTRRIKVGLGIVPAVSRNAAFTAMEFATLARLYPGRFLPGIGHGVGRWMQQIGAFPTSQLAALEEVVQAVRALLRGQRFTLDGQHVHLQEVQLDFPPAQVPPVQLGVRGARSLAVSGRSADGTILAEGAAPAYLEWARRQIAQGQAQAGRDDPHRLTVYVWTNIGDSREAARVVIRPMIAQTLPHLSTQLEPAGLQDEVIDVLDEYGEAGFAAAMPDRWLDMLTVSGITRDCIASVQRFIEAGADSVVFVLPEWGEDGQIERLGRELIPAFRS
jgi:5,10-methylenetetrahydromethanopterin reductase